MRKTVILGNERMLVEEELKPLLEGIEPEDIIRFSGYSEEIPGELESMSFWGPRVILISSKDGRDIPGNLVKTEHQNDLIIVVEEIDKRSSLYKALDHVEIKNCNSLPPEKLVGWLLKMFHTAGLNITQSTMDILLERLDYGISSDLFAVKLTAEQVITYCETKYSCEITQDIITEVCENNSPGNHFDIIKHLETGNFVSLMEEVEKVEKGDELMVLGLLLSKFRVKFKLSLFPNEQEGMNVLSVKPWSVLKISAGQTTLKEAINIVFSATQDIKSGCGRDALKMCVQKLSLLLSKEVEHV